MKKFIIISLLLIMSSALFSQETNPSATLTKQDYLKKSRHQKTAAWLLIGGGFVLSSAGVIGALVEESKAIWGTEPESTSNTPGVLFFSGGVMMLSSIPLFIASSKNKKKAKFATVSFKNEKTLQVMSHSYVYRFVPSVSLKIEL